MNKVKVFVPAGFLDQYAEYGITDKMIMTFLTQMQSNLNVRQTGISLFIAGNSGSPTLTTAGMGISLFITSNTIWKEI